MLNVAIDASRLERWATELSARGLKNAVRRAVDQSATAARRKALDTIAQDIGVPKARIKSAVGKVVRTTQSSLSASFTTTKLRIGIKNVAGATLGRSGLRASTHRLSGGGSSALYVKGAFMIKSNGGQFVSVRRGKSRLPLKGIYAETPATAMGQKGAPAQVTWGKAANAELSQRLPRELTKQFYSERMPYTSPTDSGD